MYVLIRVDGDEASGSSIRMMAASESLSEVRNMMIDEYEAEYEHPSNSWLDAWDEEYCFTDDMNAACQTECLEYVAEWFIFDTDNMAGFDLAI